MLSKVRSHINRALLFFLFILMISLVLDVSWQVFSRYALGSPSSFTDELARYLLIWVALLGSAYATGQNLHISIDLLPERYKSSYSGVVVQVFIILFSLLVLVIGGSNLVYLTLSLDQISAALRLPLGYIYIVIPLSGIIIIIYSVLNIFDKPKPIA